MNNAVTWFEIPTEDLDRATRFYERVLGAPMKREVFGGSPMAIFQNSERPAVGGALVVQRGRAPAANGTLVYLNTLGQLDAALARVPAAGGQVVVPKTDIGDHGHFALVRDSEGNVVGLHDPR